MPSTSEPGARPRSQISVPKLLRLRSTPSSHRLLLPRTSVHSTGQKARAKLSISDFGSLLIQDGASLAYVKEQMGHSSIQITVDTYGHLIPGADINWIDGLDRRTSQQQNATPAQPALAQAEPDPHGSTLSKYRKSLYWRIPARSVRHILRHYAEFRTMPNVSAMAAA
jgi:hypothetical protein